MKIITFDDIKGLNVPLSDCYAWVERMIRNKKDAILPAKAHISLPENVFCNVMPSCIFENDGVIGVKIVTRYPKRTPSLDSKILILDSKTGEFLSLMDGNWITAIRTGAVAAHTVRLFARNEYETVGMIGLGNIARASLLILNSVEKRHLKIKLLKYKDQAEQFIERFSDHPNLEFEITDSVEECINDSDVIISCATYFENDIAEDRCFKEGILVVPVHTRGFTNCDLFFDKVYADDTGHVDHFKNFNKFRCYSEVSDVVNGNAAGRESDSERIVVYNIGISIHDIYFASQIYRLFQGRQKDFECLTDIELNDPSEKFWV